MKTASNHVVGISYQLTEKGSDELIEKVTPDDPFVFLMGAGNLLEAFEEKLTGLSVGDTFDFILESEDAYGPVDENAIVKVPVEAFFINGRFAEELVVVGKPIRMQDQYGNPLIGRVKERGLENVTIDFNHPMAGKALHFRGEIVSIRPATEEELEHGHVHGPGGHYH
jgi:FKBP-type peptidyl-prolyl cis-trans isomerase SlyD